ncbi:PepSY domain-containing protein [Roseisolibacter agri]|uniref:PepSY domain-containing protein n=1 Tax=Roseisolibacter agri TaxID=2014610 RepID=A0AA37Q659_9BACT|nr:PepSY domain-containing protein [Roseisolibacter agri]GLC25402.1 hypothetical protein rosag_19150 [Roseisolibacter agri]
MRIDRRTVAGAGIAVLLVVGCADGEPAATAAPATQRAAAREASGAIALREDTPGLLARATVSEATARAAALARVPGGQVLEAELEEEDGVLLFAYDIRTADGRTVMDVEVDAATGRVLRVVRDDDDARKDDVRDRG